MFFRIKAGILVVAAAALAACGAGRDPWAAERGRMVSTIAEYPAEHRVRDKAVLDAMRAVPRHEFVPASVRSQAYADRPLPIGEGQTISQPFIVAFMTQELRLGPKDRVLEIGTGSGYQAAVLAEIAAEVYSIEIVESLGLRAKETLERLGYGKVRVRIGDGYRGWPEAAPFDAVMVTCAPDHIPKPLVDQLKEGGRIVIPVGADLGGGPFGAQELVVVRKTGGRTAIERRMPVRFVPMTGEAQTTGE